MLCWVHYNNGVTPEAQLKLLHHFGEGLGHQSNTGIINELDLFWGEKYPIVLENVLGLRCFRVEGLAVTGLNSEWSSHLSMKEIIPLCLVQQTHKISQELSKFSTEIGVYQTKSLGVVVGGCGRAWGWIKIWVLLCL